MAGVAAAGVLAERFGSLSAASVMGDPKLAAAFLNRATFGATDASVAALASQGVDMWFQSQTTAPPPGASAGYWAATPNYHLNFVMRRGNDFTTAYQQALAAAQAAAGPGGTPAKVNKRQVLPQQFQESFWARAVTGEDQLRHRMALAL